MIIRKKGQMEIMGLVIVLMLLSFGLLFVIKFVYLAPERDIRQEHSESQMSANLLNSMLQATAPNCSNQQIKALFRDCSLNQEIKCVNNNKSCEFLNRTLKVIFNRTLDKWNRRYFFNATNLNENIAFGAQCPGDYDSKFYPIQAGDKTVIVTLKVCQ